MTQKPFYDSELLIAMIRKHCNNHDDLSKILNACECLKEALDEEATPPLNSSLTINQLLAQAENEKNAIIAV